MLGRMTAVRTSCASRDWPARARGARAVLSGPSYARVASFKTADAFRQHLRAAGIALDLDGEAPLAGRSAPAQPIEVGGVRVGNRFCILPMEGWDGTADGRPSELTTRRWRRFDISGAKVIWGGEAVAVRHDGRANPHQLLMTPETQACHQPPGSGRHHLPGVERAAQRQERRRDAGDLLRDRVDVPGAVK
jgi:hypothetical protein